MRQKLKIMVKVSLLVATTVLLSFETIPLAWRSVSLDMLPIFILVFRHGSRARMLCQALLGVCFMTFIYAPVQFY